jgi:penicillin-binding protein 1B
LQFEDHRLAHVDAPSASPAGTWRIEPKELARWSAQNALAHPQVRLENIPPYVPQAIVAMEDKRFYDHGALDLIGLLRAMSVDMRHGHLSQGASTISQQLARSIFLSSQRTFRRKALEAFFAFYLEKRFTKPQLLEMYLNQVYWGQDGPESLLGLESASRSFFGKPARELTLAQSAMLAGLLQSPGHYSPRTSPEIALERRDLVLHLMRDQGLISSDDLKSAGREPLKLAPGSRQANDAAYFLAGLQDQLEQRYPGTPLPQLGWRIFTTLDPVLQQKATAAVRRLPENVGVGPQAALVALDPATGGVLAWVGGTNFVKTPFDRAGRAHRQPGSAFKPFVVLAALDRRTVTTATLLDDRPLRFRNGAASWSPQNYDRQYHQKASVWDALVYSMNVPMVNLAMKSGLDAIADYAHRAGIVSPIKLFPSMALGASEVTVPEITNAYATLASGGVYRPYYRIEAITDADNRAIETHLPTPQAVFNSASVALLTKMLEAVITDGTAKPAKAMGLTIPAAGKTGTSENFQDAWFVGYSSRLVCGVWVGYDHPKSLGRAAAGIALPIWVDFMRHAVHAESAAPLESSQGLVRKTIDTETGLLVRSGCVKRREVEFLPGTEPTQLCDKHMGGIIGFFKRLATKAPPAALRPH